MAMERQKFGNQQTAIVNKQTQITEFSVTGLSHSQDITSWDLTRNNNGSNCYVLISLFLKNGKHIIEQDFPWCIDDLISNLDSYKFTFVYIWGKKI